MPDKRDPKRRRLNARWRELIELGYEIDLGSAWKSLVLKEKFVDTGEQRVDLRYGATDRLGYELLERSLRRTVLRRGVGVRANLRKVKGAPRHSIAVVDEEHRLSYEPVPIETVLWDGQGSSTSAQANYQRGRPSPRDDEVLEIRHNSQLLRERPAKKSPKKQAGGRGKA